MIRNVCLSMLAAIVLVGCGLLSPRGETARAEAALTAFFDHLARGEYEQAEALFGADYEALTYFNPNTPTEDHAALWRNACERNGYQCLPVLRIIQTEKFSLNEFVISVEFRDAEGAAFMHGPCCGASGEEMPPVSRFEMFVVERDGQYLVTSLPVYVP